MAKTVRWTGSGVRQRAAVDTSAPTTALMAAPDASRTMSWGLEKDRAPRRSSVPAASVSRSEAASARASRRFRKVRWSSPPRRWASSHLGSFGGPSTRRTLRSAGSTAVSAAYANSESDSLAASSARLCGAARSSSRTQDRWFACDQFRSLVDLQECLFVSHREPLLELRRRNPDDTWEVLFASSGGTVHLRSVDVHLSVDTAYQGLAHDATERRMRRNA